MRELPADEAVYFADAVTIRIPTKPAFGWVKVDQIRGFSARQARVV